MNRAVCQSSMASVIPLKVFPTMMNPPVAGSRAPRWILESLPRRRPDPHSTASTTRSSVCTGLTFSQPAPRRPAWYGASGALAITPSWPAASVAVQELGRLRGVGGEQPIDPLRRRHQRVQGGQPLGGRRVEQIDAVAVQDVEEEHRKPLRGKRCGDVDGAAES